MYLRTVLLASLLSISACTPKPEPEPKGPSPAPTPNGLPPAAPGLSHDFGIVPHGEQRMHEFDLDLEKFAAGTGEQLVPLRVHLECSCGHADIRLRNEAGEERFIDGTGLVHNRPGDGERAVLHVELDTRKREAVDVEKAASRGFVVVQPLSDATGQARIRIPFLIHFGIDAPVELRPFAMLAFGTIAESSEGAALTTLAGDEAHPDLEFGEPTSSDPNLTVWLEQGEGKTTLRARCVPAERGNHRALIRIPTSLDGYVLAIEATWKVIPDLQAHPLAKISFRCQLGEPQAEADRQRQFVLVEDHDRRRPPEFVVDSVVWDDGRDASANFEVTLAPVANKERQQRVFVRYLGGLDDTFRGKIVLGKSEGSAQLPIDLVVIPSRQS